MVMPIEKYYQKKTKIFNNIPLRERELEILSLIAKGYTNTEICQNLCIENSTLRTHINNLYSALTEKSEECLNQAKRVKITLWYYKNVKGIDLGE